MSESDSTTCPICGKGTLVTVDFGDQQPESREVQTFACGHEVKASGSGPPTPIGWTWSAASRRRP